MIDDHSQGGGRSRTVILVSTVIFAIAAAIGWYLQFQRQAEIDELVDRHGIEIGELVSQHETRVEELVRSHETAIGELNTQLEQLENEKARMATERESERAQLDGIQQALASELQAEKSRRDDLEQTLNRERDAANELRAILAAEQKTASELESRLEQAREAQARLESELEQEVARLIESNGDLQKDLEERLALQQSLREQIAVVAGDVDARQAELDAARQDIDRLNGQLEQSLQDQGELKVRYVQLGEQHEQETRHFNMLQQRLERELNESRVEIRQLKNRMTVINLTSEVLFGSGSARIKPEGQKVLDLIGSSLNAYPERAISVEGHTDNVPVGENIRFESNWDLSSARARAAIDYLQKNAGVDPGRMRLVGHGEFRPVASNDTAEGRQQNRRIEIRLLPDLEFGG